jgi:hypothetical protein
MDLFMEFEYDFLETNGIPTAHCAGRAQEWNSRHPAAWISRTLVWVDTTHKKDWY